MRREWGSERMQMHAGQMETMGHRGWGWRLVYGDGLLASRSRDYPDLVVLRARHKQRVRAYVCVCVRARACTCTNMCTDVRVCARAWMPDGTNSGDRSNGDERPLRWVGDLNYRSMLQA